MSGPFEIAANNTSERFGYPFEEYNRKYNYKFHVIKAREYMELGQIRDAATAKLFALETPESDYKELLVEPTDNQNADADADADANAHVDDQSWM